MIAWLGFFFQLSRECVVTTNKKAYYIDADVANLGGVENMFSKPTSMNFCTHIKGDLRDALQKLIKSDENSVLMPFGQLEGDRFQFILFTDVGVEEVNGCLDNVVEKYKKINIDNSFCQIPYFKKPQIESRAGMYFGYGLVEINSRTIEEVYRHADAQAELMKLETGENLMRIRSDKNLPILSPDEAKERFKQAVDNLFPRNFDFRVSCEDLPPSMVALIRRIESPQNFKMKLEYFDRMKELLDVRELQNNDGNFVMHLAVNNITGIHAQTQSFEKTAELFSKVIPNKIVELLNEHFKEGEGTVEVFKMSSKPRYRMIFSDSSDSQIATFINDLDCFLQKLNSQKLSEVISGVSSFIMIRDIPHTIRRGEKGLSLTALLIPLVETEKQKYETLLKEKNIEANMGNSISAFYEAIIFYGKNIAKTLRGNGNGNAKNEVIYNDYFGGEAFKAAKSRALN